MALDSFLQIDGIAGESQDDKHKDWIEILAYSHAISQPASATVGSAGGGTTSRSEHSPFVITKYVDKASAKLYDACSNGKHISKVKLEVCRAGGTQLPYLVVNMEAVIISNVAASHAAGSKDLPTEDVSFNYAKIEWIYTQQKRADGSGGGNVTASYNVAAGKSA